MISDDGAVLSAAGLRFAADGFFSECYLEAPVDAALSALSRYPVRREKIFEVTSLASRSPHTVGSFLRKIIACGEAAGFEWAFFTATAPLKALLERMSLPLVPLAAADRSRVPIRMLGEATMRLSRACYAVHRDVVGARVGRDRGEGGACLKPCRSCAAGSTSADGCPRCRMTVPSSRARARSPSRRLGGGSPRPTPGNRSASAPTGRTGRWHSSLPGPPARLSCRCPRSSAFRSLSTSAAMRA